MRIYTPRCSKLVNWSSLLCAVSQLFFVIFLVIANFFVLNMFVGVIVDSFQTSGNSVGDSDAAKAKRRAYERKQAQKEAQQQERFEQCVAPPAANACEAVA